MPRIELHRVKTLAGSYVLRIIGGESFAQYDICPKMPKSVFPDVAGLYYAGWSGFASSHKTPSYKLRLPQG